MSQVIAGRGCCDKLCGAELAPEQNFNTRCVLGVKRHSCWAVRVLDVARLLYCAKRNSTRTMELNEFQSRLRFSCKGILRSVNHFVMSQNG